MSLEYLTINTLTAYPFKDGRVEHSDSNLSYDTFLDILFVAADSKIRRPYISRMQAEADQLNIFFKDAADDAELFTISVASGDLVSHFKNSAVSFYGASNPKAHVKLVFGPDISNFFALGKDVLYGPEHTELSPAAVVYAPPKVTSVAFESYVYISDYVQDLATIHKYLASTEVELEAGTNNQFEYSPPSTQYIDIARGLGQGLYDPCNSGIIEDVLTINGIGPNNEGNLFLKTGDCYASKLLTENVRVYLETLLPQYKNFSIHHQVPNSYNILAPENTNHGIAFENFCTPRCAPERMSAFAEYLNRVVDGAVDVFSFIFHATNTRGTCKSLGEDLQALSFCSTSVVFENSVPCQSGFIKYFHEGRKIKVYYASERVYRDYTIKEVLSDSLISLNETFIAGASGEAMEFRVQDLGFIDNLNFLVTLHNWNILKYDDPYVETNYSTVDAYYTDKRYGTFTTTITVIYNPGKDPINFNVSLNIVRGMELVQSSVKIRYSDGTIKYGDSSGTIPCKDYAIYEVIFFTRCGGNHGEVIISVLDDYGEDFTDSPTTININSIECSTAKLADASLQVLEGQSLSYFFASAGEAGSITPASYTLRYSEKPAWLGIDLSLNASAANLYTTEPAYGDTSKTYSFLLVVVDTVGATYQQNINLRYIAKPRLNYLDENKNIDIYFPDAGKRTYVVGAPLYVSHATNSPKTYRSVGLPSGITFSNGRLLGKIILSNNAIYPLTYSVTLWAANIAGESAPLHITITIYEYLAAPDAIYHENYCFNFPSDVDRVGENLLRSDYPWLILTSKENITTQCSLSGYPTGSTSDEKFILIRYLYPDTYKDLFVKLAYVALLDVTYPPDGSVFSIYPPDYVENGVGRTWTEASPLLTLDGASGSSNYVVTGLPTGLNVSNGHIVGSISDLPGSYTVSVSLQNSAGMGKTSTFTLKLFAASETTQTALEGKPFCYNLQNISEASSFKLSSSSVLPNWLTFSSKASAVCDFEGTASGSTSGNIDIWVDLNFDGGSTRRAITIPYIALPRIVEPAENQEIEISDNNYTSLNFTEASPLLNLVTVNAPTSFSLTGQPPGLTITNTGKIVGTLQLGTWAMVVTATNLAGTTTRRFKLIVRSVPTALNIYEGKSFCHAITRDSVQIVGYAYEGVLPPWMTFDGSVSSSCNFNVVGASQTYSEVFENITILKLKVDGGEIRQNIVFNYIAKPRITYPLKDTKFSVLPPDSTSRIFNSAEPLCAVGATNSPTGYTLQGMPSKTLSIDTAGRIIGQVTTVNSSSPIKVQLYASNSAGSSDPLDIFIYVSKTSKTVTVTEAVPICYTIDKLDNPEALNLEVPTALSWVTLDLTDLGGCEISGALPATFQSSGTYNISIVRSYVGGQLRENIVVNVLARPRINSINSGVDPATRNTYLIAPPDYAFRTYLPTSPLLTISATNNPTSFNATGLPGSLSMDSGGRVVGGPVTGAPGIYTVSVQATGPGGVSDQFMFDIDVSYAGLELNTNSGIDVCYKINTKDNATSYSINKSLKSNLIFDQSPGAACNIRGRIVSGVADFQDDFIITSTYTGGSSKVYLKHINLNTPTIVSPYLGETIHFLPSFYENITFTETSPILTIAATNNANQFIAGNLPAGLSITSEGKIIGKITGVAAVYTVNVAASNTSGLGQSSSFKLDLTQLTPKIVWNLPSTIVYNQPLSSSELNAYVTPAIAGNFTYLPPEGTTLGSIGNKTLTVTFTPTNTQDYTTATSTATIYVMAGAPVINSIYTGNLEALKTTYIIAPPDYAFRTYTAFSPLLTISATNNPTSFNATGLPGSLSMDSGGRVVGGPVTGAPGIYTVSVQATNTQGTGPSADFKIEIIDSVPVFNTYTNQNLCIDLEAKDNATQYTLTEGSALFTGLTFNGSPTAGCNVLGTPTSNVPSQQAVLNIRSDYVGGSSTRAFKLIHLAKSRMIYPLDGQTIRKYPASFLGVTYTEADPLFKLEASNNPTGYVCTNLPAGLTVDSSGNVIGTLDSSSLSNYSVSVYPVNASGSGDTVVFQLDLSTETTAIVWDTPNYIIYGTVLSSTQLNAQISPSWASGTIKYFNGNTEVFTGTILQAGFKVLRAIFTPTSALKYSQATKDVTLEIKQATPVITWASISDKVYGTVLNTSKLDAVSTTPGTFVYTPGLGTVLPAGTHELKAFFTPTDTANFTTAQATNSIIIAKATPVLQWPAPADIREGTPLSNVQLNAVARSSDESDAVILNGVYTYSYKGNVAQGYVLPVGTHYLNVSFVVSAADSLNFISTPITKTKTITVVRAA
jgi:hypothetical protein